MDEQTIKLLEECCSGCRMAVESFEQIKEYVKDTDLKKLISDYTEKHRSLEKEAASLLKESGNEEQSAGFMASALSRLTTEIKLTFNSDNSQVAKLLIDGCTMGIKTLGEKANQYDLSVHQLKHCQQLVQRQCERLCRGENRARRFHEWVEWYQFRY